jgi:hypothetical protein
MERIMHPDAYAPFFLGGENWDSVTEYADSEVLSRGRKEIRKINTAFKPGTQEYNDIIMELRGADIDSRLLASYEYIYTKIINETSKLKDLLLQSTGKILSIYPNLVLSDLFLSALLNVRRDLFDEKTEKKLIEDRISRTTYMFDLYKNANSPDSSSDDILGIEWKKNFSEPLPEDQGVAIDILMKKTKNDGYRELLIKTYYNGVANPVIAKYISGDINKAEAEELIFQYNPLENMRIRDNLLVDALKIWAELKEKNLDGLSSSETKELSHKVYSLFEQKALDEVSMIELDPFMFEIKRNRDEHLSFVKYTPLYNYVYEEGLETGKYFNIYDSPFNPENIRETPLIVDGVEFETINEFVFTHAFIDLYNEYSVSNGFNHTNKDLYFLARDGLTLSTVYNQAFANAVVRGNLAKFIQNVKAVAALDKFEGRLSPELQKLKDENDARVLLDFEIFDIPDKFMGLNKAPLPPVNGDRKKWNDDRLEFVTNTLDEILRVTRNLVKAVNEMSEQNDLKITPLKIEVVTRNLLLSPPDAPGIDTAMNLYVPQGVVSAMFQKGFGINFDISCVPIIQEYVYKRLYWVNEFANKQEVSMLDYKVKIDCECKNGYLEKSHQCTCCALMHVFRVLQTIYPEEVLTPLRLFSALSILDPSKKTLRLIQKANLVTWTKEIPMDMKRQLGSSFRQVANPATLKLVNVSIEALSNNKDKDVIRTIKRYSAAFGQVDGGVPYLNLNKSQKYESKIWRQGAPERTFVPFIKD